MTDGPPARRFTVSARSKAPGTPILGFLAEEYPQLAWDEIESVFGFVDPCALYGGRPFAQPELSQRDVLALADAGIGLRLPLSNHWVTREEYEAARWLLEKHHREGNSVITVSEPLAAWIRADFPLFEREASVIKDICTHLRIDAALEHYDTIVLPMRCCQDEAFLAGIRHKQRITLFANAGCALACPARICYPSFSNANKGTGEPTRCSFDTRPRDLLGMIDFDVEHLRSLGFHRFKLLRSRNHGLTGF